MRHVFRKPSFRAIIFPHSEPDDLISITLFNLMSLSGMSLFPEIIAGIWAVYRLIQWQTRPCLQTYQSLPPWLSPRASQIVTPHPLWVTMLQFPKLRDRVIERQDLYANARFVNLYAQSLRINWPFQSTEMINFENGHVVITDLFEKHISDIGNWSVTEPFTCAFPELQSACRFLGRQ